MELLQTYFKDAEKYKYLLLVTDGSNCGMIVPANNCDEGLKFAREEYSLGGGKTRLNCTQVYESGLNHMRNKIFEKIQFNISGGVWTHYNKSIDELPPQSAIEFLKEGFTYIKFFNKGYEYNDNSLMLNYTKK